MTYDKRMMIDYCRRMMESLRRTTNRRLSTNDGKLTMYDEQMMTDDCRWMKKSLRRTTNRRWQTTVAEWRKAYDVQRTDDETTVAEWWKAYNVRRTYDDRRLSPNDGKLTTYDEQTMTDDCRWTKKSLRRTTNRRWLTTVAEWWKAYDVQQTDKDRRLSLNDGKS